MKTPEQIFRESVKGYNFMTPNIIRYGETKYFIYELSTGMFLSDKLFGITVIEKSGYRRNDLSCCKHSEMDALRYIASLDEVN